MCFRALPPCPLCPGVLGIQLRSSCLCRWYFTCFTCISSAKSCFFSLSRVSFCHPWGHGTRYPAEVDLELRTTIFLSLSLECRDCRNELSDLASAFILKQFNVFRVGSPSGMIEGRHKIPITPCSPPSSLPTPYSRWCSVTANSNGTVTTRVYSCWYQDPFLVYPLHCTCWPLQDHVEFFIALKISCVLPTHHSLLQLLIATDLFTISIVFRLPKCHVPGILCPAAFVSFSWCDSSFPFITK